MVIKPVEIRTSFSLSYSFYTYKVHIDFKDIKTNIPDGYTFTEYFSNGNPRVTATWEWI